MMPKEVSKRLEEFKQQVCQHLRELQDRLASVVQKRPKSTNSEDIPRMQEEVATFSVNFQKQPDIIRKELQAISDSVLRQEERIDELKQYSRRNCLPFHGVAEKPGEIVTDAVLKIMKETLNINIEQSAIDCGHRIGKPIRSAAQAFCSMLFHAKRTLKNTPFVITESLMVDRQRVLKSAKEKFGPRSCWTQDGRIVVLHTNRHF
ncbi:hypothetical protein PR048_013349 [Dryococelus australis]|uniref:Uncharacterized protein n=1 Tax=Dryococelus australis TaxID=614101 RepID=A0ABQ9HRW9_9NEOP|nr:hypothetical protein PR048_013349 [Dryococelus australis]